MKKIYLCLALILGLALSASASWAITPDHEAQYLWYYNSETGGYGTLVDQIIPTDTSWTIGDTSGETIAEVREKFWIVFDEELGRDVGEFSWTVWNDDLTNILIPELPDLIQSFAISSYGWEPLEYTTPTGWSFEHDDGMYIWYVENAEDGIVPRTSLGGFSVTVDTTLWTISEGGIDYLDPEAPEGHVVLDGNGFWRASHPGVPEPASMSLLGLGLLGFGGRLFRKRFKA